MVRLTVENSLPPINYMSFYNLFFALSIRRSPIYKRFIVKSTKIAHISIKSAKNLVNIVIFIDGKRAEENP